MKTKSLLRSVVSVCSVLIVGIACYSNEQAGPPGRISGTNQEQIIQLDAAAKLSLLGVTQGRRHVAPGFERFGRFNPIDGVNDSTVVWIKVEYEPRHWPSYELLVYDKANTACVTSEARSRSRIKEGVEVHGFVLESFPRWDKEVILRARSHDGPVADGLFVITNPAPSTFTNWIPKPLPDTQTDGDFEVTLKRLATGAPEPYWEGKTPTPANDLVKQCIRLDFDFRLKGEPVTNWLPRMVWTSDAAGNHVSSALRDYPPNGIYAYPPTGERDGYFYRPGLWPDEPAWKVRLEFTRTSGFSDEEILTLTNIPVRLGTQKDRDDEWTWEPGDTNSALSDYTVNGIQLKLFPPILHPDKSQPGQMFISVIMRPNPNPETSGVRMTLIQATDDQGRELWTPFTPHAGYNCSIEFPNPRDVKALNLKLALHKSRFVEFIVQPEKSSDTNGP